MNFIIIPFVVGIITWGIYAIFELMIRRKERIIMVEKMGDKITPDMINPTCSLPSFKSQNISSNGTLKAAGLFMGLGLGLLIGFFITYFTLGLQNDTWSVRNLREIVIGASTIMGGGLGLLIAFIVEIKMAKKK